MCFLRFLFFCFLLFAVACSPQINLHLTDRVSNNKTDVSFQHDCLYVAAFTEKKSKVHQIVSYCLTEWLPKWNFTKNNLDQHFTFAQLYKQNITSQQLYLWSTPMDVVERYQLYLNHHVTLDETSEEATQLFYNCTFPRFGPFCQYSLDIYESRYLSLNESIYIFYQQRYDPTNLTCYTHLECHRGTALLCLDWTEICDDIVDCQDGIDEQSCTQLESNTCDEDEFQCRNGQCISKTFWHDGGETFECLDRTDENPLNPLDTNQFFVNFSHEPVFAKEDILCPRRHYKVSLKLTSSCQGKRETILRKLLLSDDSHSMSGNCWLAVTCELRNTQGLDPKCRNLCPDRTCLDIITKDCPDMFPVPDGTLAFGHMFFAYTKEDIIKRKIGPPPPRYVCYNDQLCDGLYSNRSLISFNNATCRRSADFPLTFNSYAIARSDWYQMYIAPLSGLFDQCNKIIYNRTTNCDSSTMYQCINSSKCISSHRFCNALIDCPYKDDENCSPINGSCSIFGLGTFLGCTRRNISFPLVFLNDGICTCGFDEYNLCDDEVTESRYIRKHISFPTICDGFTELIPVLIDGRKETYETDCESWQCNNTYTRCDGFWNCFNGADEVDCDTSPLINCSSHHHICVSPNTSQFMCLPPKNANDGRTDCLGGTDEPKLCRLLDYIEDNDHNFYCITYSDKPCLSDLEFCKEKNCKDGADQQFCDKT